MKNYTFSRVILGVTAWFLASQMLFAATDKYRLCIRSNPSNSIVIAWNQISGTTGTVYYGTTDHGTNWSAYPSSKSVDRSVTDRGMNNKFARLSGLQANTAYYFVIKDSEGTSARYWFKTAPNVSSERLSFITGGDSRNNYTPRRNANKIVSKLRPHAVFFGGDMTSSGTDAQWRQWFDDWQYTTGSDGRMIPIVAARGNHESSNTIIYNLFDVPSSDVYYALTFGNNLVRAYTLNTETSISGSQTSWLSSDLSSANTIWKMAQYHKPMRPHVASKAEGNSQYDNWAQLFHDNEVKLVIECDAHTVKNTWPIKPSSSSGHDEGFIRDDATGTVYAGEGCWGAPLRTNDDDKSWTRNSGVFNQVKWVFVDENKIEIRTVKVDNAGSVGTVNDNNIFTPPANLDIWSPSNGSVVTIYPNSGGNPGGDNSISVAISNGNDDVEENGNTGGMYMNSTDIELVYDGSKGNQKIGLRFQGISIPQGATITDAYIQFTTDEVNSGSCNLTIKGEDVNSAGAFSTSSYNVSNRTTTSASVSWNPAAWNTIGQSGSSQGTPQLKNIVQEIVDRSGWNSGNNMAFIITGTGERTAESYEGSSSQAPVLHITFDEGGSGSQNFSTNSRVNTGNDDAEEAQSGTMYLTSSDLELVYDDYQSAGNQKVGMRFVGLGIPQGATITNAYIQFTTDETNSGSSNLTIRGEDVNDAAGFSSSANNISNRPLTSASVAWSPAAWNTVGETGSNQKTPNIKTVVQEIVNRSGWNSSSDMVIIINGTGERTAESYNGSSSKAPILYVDYTTGSNKYEVAFEKHDELFSNKVVDNAFVFVYPNPFDNELIVELSEDLLSLGEVSTKLMDLSGRIVQTSSANDNKIFYNTVDLNAGVYFVIVEQNGEVVRTQKLIKQ